jgi:hypothetical protein
MENSKKKLTGIEKNFIRSLNRNAQAIQKQRDRITQKVEKFVAENKVKTDELDKLLTDIDNNIKSYTGGLTFDDYFGEESEGISDIIEETNGSDNDIELPQSPTTRNNPDSVLTEEGITIRSPFDEDPTNACERSTDA